VGALVCAVALTAAAPAVAAPGRLASTLTVTGSVTIAWHGDPARGCAGAGLCGYRGSLGARPDRFGQLTTLLRHGRPAEGEGYLDLIEAPVTRVRRVEEAGDGGACADLARSSALYVTMTRRADGRLRLRLDADGLSPGRCAGPDLTHAMAGLRGTTISTARLLRGGTVDMSSHAPLASGRFSGTVASTVRLRLGHARPQTDHTFTDFGQGVQEQKRRSPQVVHLHATYRVTRLTGKLATSFGGLAAPLCATVDGCGVSGASSWAILSAGGSVELDAFTLAPPRDRSLRGAIDAIGKRGGLAFAAGRFRHALGTTAAHVTRPDGVACNDAQRVPAPGLSSPVNARSFQLDLGGEQAEPGEGDVVRAGCPGPAQQDVLGTRPLATASLPLRALLYRRVQIEMSGAGRFGDDAYAGTRGAHFTLTLRRVRKPQVSYEQGALPR
ncbi:MAG: hypothetical protein QOF55_2179, partial [Thermoleophilaceae bacterium]|nr:hypothetical protein [Thermoleophilaceae bacterium]